MTKEELLAMSKEELAAGLIIATGAFLLRLRDSYSPFLLWKTLKQAVAEGKANDTSILPLTLTTLTKCQLLPGAALLAEFEPNI